MRILAAGAMFFVASLGSAFAQGKGGTGDEGAHLDARKVSVTQTAFSHEV